MGNDPDGSDMETRLLGAAEAYRHAVRDNHAVVTAELYLRREAKELFLSGAGECPPTDETPEAELIRAAISYGAARARVDILRDRLVKAATNGEVIDNEEVQHQAWLVRRFQLGLAPDTPSSITEHDCDQTCNCWNMGYDDALDYVKNWREDGWQHRRCLGKDGEPCEICEAVLESFGGLLHLLGDGLKDILPDRSTVAIMVAFVNWAGGDSIKTYYILPGAGYGSIERTLSKAGFVLLSNMEHMLDRQQARQRTTVRFFRSSSSESLHFEGDEYHLPESDYAQTVGVLESLGFVRVPEPAYEDASIQFSPRENRQLLTPDS